MCLIISKKFHPNNDVPKLVENDFHVWKVLAFDKDIKKFQTPYQKYPIDFTDGKCELPSYTLEEFTVDGYGTRGIKEGNGYHAFTSRFTANFLVATLDDSDFEGKYVMKIFKCLVPKGSYVYFGCGCEIACSSLTIIDEDYVPENQEVQN